MPLFRVNPISIPQKYDEASGTYVDDTSNPLRPYDGGGAIIEATDAQAAAQAFARLPQFRSSETFPRQLAVVASEQVAVDLAVSTPATPVTA